MPLLPIQPNLDQLRRQAKELLRAAKTSDPEACERIEAVSGEITLAGAQLAVAREYGFASWPKLKAEAETRALCRPSSAAIQDAPQRCSRRHRSSTDTTSPPPPYSATPRVWPRSSTAIQALRRGPIRSRAGSRCTSPARLGGTIATPPEPQTFWPS
jgi:hypothetical protein